MMCWNLDLPWSECCCWPDWACLFRVAIPHLLWTQGTVGGEGLHLRRLESCSFTLVLPWCILFHSDEEISKYPVEQWTLHSAGKRQTQGTKVLADSFLIDASSLAALSQTPLSLSTASECRHPVTVTEKWVGSWRASRQPWIWDWSISSHQCLQLLSQPVHKVMACTR